MKCKICEQETCWDDSVGLENFIVCNKCYYALANEFSKEVEKIKNGLTLEYSAMLQLIFKMGKLNKEN